MSYMTSIYQGYIELCTFGYLDVPVSLNQNRLNNDLIEGHWGHGSSCDKEVPMKYANTPVCISWVTNICFATPPRWLPYPPTACPNLDNSRGTRVGEMSGYVPYHWYEFTHPLSNSSPVWWETGGQSGKCIISVDSYEETTDLNIHFPFLENVNSTVKTYI